ncbi:MAG: hypothetical protein AB3N24_16880 [Leisingera sp.]
MDFNKFDTVAAAEKGADFHVMCPATQQPLFDNSKNPYEDNGKPCTVTLLGSEASAVRAAAREAQKAKAAAKPDADGGDDFVSYDDLHDQMVEKLIPLVIGFKNIRNGNKAAAKEDAAWFFNLTRFNGKENEPSFAEQAVKFVGSRASYLGNVSTG